MLTRNQEQSHTRKEHDESIGRVEHVTIECTNCQSVRLSSGRHKVALHAAFPACVSGPHSKALTPQRLAIVHGMHEESLRSLTWAQLGPTRRQSE